MNDYKKLMKFIEAQALLAPVSPGESTRDLYTYFHEKLDNPSNDRGDVREMANRALRVAGLRPRNSSQASTLDAPENADLRARAAALLAMSIIRDMSENELTSQYARLRKLNQSAVLSELRVTLKKGDVVQSRKHPKLEMKNFSSAGTRASIWRHEIEDAYEKTHGMLLQCEMRFLVGGTTLTGPLDTAFRAYFGDPAAVVDTSALPFSDASKPVWTPSNQTRLEVVREVMRRVCRNFVRQSIRIYFGGRSIDDGTFAYVSGKTNPTKIHVGGQFFTKGKEGLASEAGTIVHECTHTFAGTKDHKYRDDPCKQLAINDPAKAMANADSYKFFVEAAFGS
ncbi:hypothetical protein ATSB10_16120 [Dyella thiooxydans]|uniref:Lysine-specific metallo-endopeptidase domain-containing protein n=1 Tax=Dyella thiooxydans TaxID=445710 RepID=A0A160N064_9GAMM|nr:M35 family metallo-endopeptidase [Dyella thiooxydans]AND69066.1 hypothetical protein ATSB10_16120 [Dyella thiooxydans]